MKARASAVAGRFYPADATGCAQAVDQCLAQARAALAPSEAALLGGVVPHAGWVFSGATAALTFVALDVAGAPATVCLLGAVHRVQTPSGAAWPGGDWVTPLGHVATDTELTAAIVGASGGAVVTDAAPHLGEHAIEVQVPFVQRLWPEARVVAIEVPATPVAVDVGAAIAAALQGRTDVTVIASSDLTHYGASAYGFAPSGWGEGSDALESGKANDRPLLARVMSLDAPGVLAEAQTHRSACGAGAIAAATAYAQACGARRGLVLAHTTSAEVRPGQGTDAFVGYAAMVFEGPAPDSAANPAGNRENPPGTTGETRR